MILESIVTTRNLDGSTHLAPMGACCDRRSLDRFELRPFCESTTFANLVREGSGVLHVTDDVLLFAESVTGNLRSNIPLRDAERVPCQVLEGTCHYVEFEVTHIERSAMRASMPCRALQQVVEREFFGFNRAMGQILEAAILATRLDRIPADEIRARMSEMDSVIRKTGGEREWAAWEMIQRYVERVPGDFPDPARIPGSSL